MTQRCTKVGSVDELERQVMRDSDDPKVEHPRDVPVMQERRQPCLTKKHLHELRVTDKRRQDPLETNALFESTRPTANRDKRLRHAPDSQPLA
jgi:hypothetical protein